MTTDASSEETGFRECELSGEGFPYAGLAILFILLLIPSVVTLQKLQTLSCRNVGWLVWLILEFVSDIGTAYQLRPTEFCQGDGIIGGWQFSVQVYVVVVTTSILMLFLTCPILAEKEVHLWPGLFALTLTGAIADFSPRSVHTTIIVLVFVYVAEIPALVVTCNLLSHDLARGASPQWWVWVNVIVSVIGVVWRLGRMCCGKGEQVYPGA